MLFIPLLAGVLKWFSAFLVEKNLKYP